MLFDYRYIKDSSYGYGSLKPFTGSANVTADYNELYNNASLVLVYQSWRSNDNSIYDQIVFLPKTATLPTNDIYIRVRNDDYYSDTCPYGFYSALDVNSGLTLPIYEHYVKRPDTTPLLYVRGSFINGMTAGLMNISSAGLTPEMYNDYPIYIRVVKSDYNIYTFRDFTDTPTPITPEPAPTIPDPYDPAGITEPDGGNGNWGIVGDDILPCNTPTTLNNGLINAYKMTVQEIGNFARYLWTPNLLENIVKNMYAVIDNIIGLNAYPFAVTASTQSEYVVMGNVAMTGDLSVTGKYIPNNFHKISCGFLDVPTSSGRTYLDYSPYTKVSIYLPFIGIQALNPDEIINKRLMVDYYVDIISGACMAVLSVIKGDKTQCIAMYSGSCNSDIPITGASYSNKLNNLISTIGSGLALAGGIAGGITSVGAGMATINNATSLATEKPNIHRSGSLNGSMGFCSPVDANGKIVPYLIIEHPVVAHAENENTFRGYPSEITYKLSDLSGYTIVDEIHIEKVSATDTELTEIENLLKSGVII